MTNRSPPVIADAPAAAPPAAAPPATAPPAGDPPVVACQPAEEPEAGIAAPAAPEAPRPAAPRPAATDRMATGRMATGTGTAPRHAEEERRPTRRQFLSNEFLTMAFAGVAAMPTITGGTAWLVDRIKEIPEEARQSVRNMSRYRDIFLRDLGSQFYFRPGNVIYNREATPDDDLAAITAINSFFALDRDCRILPDGPDLTMDTALICIGSPATNLFSNRCFTCIGQHTICDADGRPYRLEFAHFTDVSERTVRRMLNGKSVVEPNYQIRDVGRRRTYDSFLERDGQPRDAYLLFSKLPHPVIRNRAVTVWAGNIGPGTEATRIVLSEDFLGTDVGRRLEVIAGSEPYFQALFKVDQIVLDRDRGRHLPTICQLLEVRPLRPPA